MLAVLTSLHKYMPRADARFAAWVTTIAVNTLRRRFRRRRPELTATGELPETADDSADLAGNLDRARQRRALLVSLGELSERERAIVSLRYGAELNASEKIGKRLFDVIVEDSLILPAHDIVYQVGTLTAENRTFFLNITDGQMDIRLVPRAGSDPPVINAARITHRTDR